MNLVILMKKNGRLSLEMYLTLSVCLGTFLMYVIGPTFHVLGGFFYSEIVVLTIGVVNLIALYLISARKYQVTLTTDSDTKILLLLFSGLLVVKFMLMNDESLFLDDQNLLLNAFNFCNNKASRFMDWYIPYFHREVEYPYEVVFSTSMGIVMKAGWPESVLVSTLLAKAYVMTLGTFAVFPIYTFLSRMIPERKVRYMFLLIMVCNQWQFIDGTYLLTVVPFTLYFTTSYYYVVKVLENDGPPGENLQLGVLVGSVALGTRYNALVPYLLLFILVIMISLIHKIRDSKPPGKPFLKWLWGIDAPRLSNIFLLLCVQVFLYFILSVPFQITYFQRNSITILDYALHYQYGYFGTGNYNQFTPVDMFSFAWLWERLSFNFPWYVLNLTQLVGFIHVATGDHGLRLAINYPISIILFVVIGLSMIYYWVRLSRKNVLSFLYQLSTFLLMFASMICWGEIFFVVYRWSYSIYILIIPPLYEMFKTISRKIKIALKLQIPEDRILVFLLSPLLAITFYGTIGFLIPLLSREVSVLRAFMKWQFAGIT